MSIRVFFALSLLLIAARAADKGEWAAYGGDPGGKKYSPLGQINLGNVSSLEPAWTFHTGDAYRPKRGRAAQFEATPLYIDGTLYFSTPLGRAIALDPSTGKALWSYDAKINRDAGYGDYANRGVSTWKAADGKRRIYLTTIDARIIALDAASGKPCLDFGDNGQILLRTGLRIPPRSDADYEETSPATVVGNVVVVGSGIADNGSVSQPSGEVRAYDVRTGKKRWTWDPIPQDPTATGANTWKNGSASKTGAANAWSVIVADPGRDTIYIPTGSASPDYYGGERLGDNLFANSLVALRASTGEMLWYFQTVHHDLWDYDVASPPLLFDVQRDGKATPAVAVASKTGHLFILNRDTGKPIFGVEERPVAQSDVPGEHSSSTQPFPVLPKSLAPEQKLTADDAWGVMDEDRAACRAEMARLRSDGWFTPPTLGGSLMTPGNIGGMPWGGAAYDEGHHLLIVPVNNLPAEVRLIPRAQFTEEAQRGRGLGAGWEFAEQAGTPFGMTRRFLLSPHKLPCIAPPWSTLAAIDADTGEIRWQVPLGRWPKTEAVPEAGNWGSLVLGGPLVTGGGLAFVAGTLDETIRAFDVLTGKVVWSAKLPASARSTPMTYMGRDGNQYVVIASGGFGEEGLPDSDSLIGYRLKSSAAPSGRVQ